MLYQYGDIVLETHSIQDVSAMQEHLVKNHGFRLGETASETTLELFHYVLIVNSDNYLDVEYRFRIPGTIIVQNKMLQIMKIITKVS